MSLFTACGSNYVQAEATIDYENTSIQMENDIKTSKLYKRNSSISEVMSDPAFSSYGRLLFPVNTNYWSGHTLEQLHLTWYSHINPDKTVEIVNYVRERSVAGEQVFFDIYTEEEKKADPPTYVCVGDSDGIANWRTMKNRIDKMNALGIHTEFHVYPGLPHGFGLGIGTVAEGWIDDAVSFWEKQMNNEDN